jgi:hypothetical protein
MMANALLFVAAVVVLIVTVTEASKPAYFQLRHLEYQSLMIDIEGGSSRSYRSYRAAIEAGAALMTRRGYGLHWYLDDGNRLRTRVNDLCVHDNAEGVLELATCSGDGEDWLYYFNKDTGVAGFVKGTDESTMHIAVWNDKKNIYQKGAKLVRKPFGEAKDDFGAEWYRKYV